MVTDLVESHPPPCPPSPNSVWFRSRWVSERRLFPAGHSPEPVPSPGAGVVAPTACERVPQGPVSSPPAPQQSQGIQSTMSQRATTRAWAGLLFAVLALAMGLSGVGRPTSTGPVAVPSAEVEVPRSAMAAATVEVPYLALASGGPPAQIHVASRLGGTVKSSEVQSQHGGWLPARLRRVRDSQTRPALLPSAQTPSHTHALRLARSGAISSFATSLPPPVHA